MSSGVSSNYLQNNFKEVKDNDLNIYEFEGFRLDAAHVMLYRNGEVVSLPPKQVETLVALVERRGEVVSKEELMTRLWPDTAVEESNLSQNIYVLRKTLGHRADGKPVIETFRRRGYRFNGEIRNPGEIELVIATHTKTQTLIEETSESPELPGNRGFASKTSPAKWRIFPIIACAALFAGLCLFAAARFFVSRSQTNKPQTLFAGTRTFKVTRLTPDQNIADASISPDGKYLVYDLFENSKHSLWLKDILTGSATQILPPADAIYCSFVFSPDGTQIYFNSRLNALTNYTLSRIPLLGGEREKIAENVISPTTLSPDGRQIAFVRYASNEHQLTIANTDGSGERVLSSRSVTSRYETWGSNLSWSPDGTRIAICGTKTVEGKDQSQLVEVLLSDGSEREIPTPDLYHLDDVAWLSDQSGLLVDARETAGTPWQIWRVSYPDGKVSRITSDTDDYDDISLSADSRVLLTKRKLENLNLWVLPADNAGAVKQITFGSTASDGHYGLAVASDGKIIYTSSRDGNVDLYSINADRSDEKQLTKNAGDFNGRPRLTPDGRTIVFVSSRSGTRQIWRIDTDGGNPQQLTEVKSADRPSLTSDGEWIYFTLWQGQKQIIAKIPIAGGEMFPVYEKNNADAALVSPDGKLLFFEFYEEDGSAPWKAGILSLETGETRLLKEGGARFWMADSKSLVFIPGNRANLWQIPIEGGQPRKLTGFENGLIRAFDISADFKQIAIARGNPTAEAVLISNFEP